jgi:hypothetical protein
MKTFLNILFASVGLLSTVPEVTAVAIVLLIFVQLANPPKSKN